MDIYVIVTVSDNNFSHELVTTDKKLAFSKKPSDFEDCDYIIVETWNGGRRIDFKEIQQ